MALIPDYDDDPGRWNSWRPKQDVQDVIAPQLKGPVLDVGCGEGRLAAELAIGVDWVGVDSSPTQLRTNPYRPVVQADMRALPFRDGVFAEVALLWCLYHVDDPTIAVAEANRVLRPRGHFFACTNSRTSDPELMWDGYPRSSFDAEEAVEIVAAVFSEVDARRWDDELYPLETIDEVMAFCRHNFIPVERASAVDVPLWLTKRGVLVHATKSSDDPTDNQ